MGSSQRSAGGVQWLILACTAQMELLHHSKTHFAVAAGKKRAFREA